MNDEARGQRSEVGGRTSSACAFRSPTADPRPLVPRVVKLGGSLLTAADWPDAFRHWLAIQPAMRTVLIVGGGSVADAVREGDPAHRLDPSDAHWLAIDAMSLTARLAARLLPEAAWTDDWCTLNAGWPELDVGVPPLGGCPPAKAGTPTTLLIFDPRQFLKQLEPTPGGTPLPHSWGATSDSIAARIADLLGSEELVLLKSCLPVAKLA